MQEDEYIDEGESSSCDEEVSFRELVELMKYNNPSSYPASGNINEWVTTEPYIDPYSGSIEEKSIHYSRDNEPRKAKYWQKAMKAAAIIR